MIAKLLKIKAEEGTRRVALRLLPPEGALACKEPPLPRVDQRALLLSSLTARQGSWAWTGSPEKPDSASGQAGAGVEAPSFQAQRDDG